MSSVLNFATTISRLALLTLFIGLPGCSQFLFQPLKPHLHSPSDANIPYADVYVTTGDGLTLHGWLLKAEQPKGVVFFLHGNAENISTHIGSVYWLPEQGYDVLLMDYRGYGKSEGVADIPEVFADVDAFYRWISLYSEQHRLPLTVLGQSLGAAISCYYFSQLPASDIAYQGIVFDAMLSGYPQMAKHVLNSHLLTWPLQFIVPQFMPGNYNPIDNIAAIHATPLLFFHSTEDQVVPFAQGKAVFERAHPPRYWVTTNGPHIATFQADSNRKILLRFLEDPDHFDPGSTTGTSAGQ